MATITLIKFVRKEKKSIITYTTRNAINWTGSDTTELADFFVALNKKYILKWHKSFVDESTAMEWLAQALCKEEYVAYIKRKEKLGTEKQRAMTADQIKEKVDKKLDQRHQEILWEFHANYTSWKYCKKEHQEILKILQALDQNGALRDDLKEASDYASIEPQPTTLPKQTYSWFRDTCLKKMETETVRILRIYRNKKLKNNNQKNIVIAHWLKLYKEQLDYYKMNVYGGGRYKSSVLHRESIQTEVEKEFNNEINNELDKKRQELQSKLEFSIQSIQNNKPQNMETTTLIKFIHEEKSSMNKSNKYTITYTVPVASSFKMQFVSIDLPSAKEDMKTNNINTMDFEMSQNESLIFHQMVNNSDIIMFIREEAEDTNITKTKVVASQSKLLSVTQRPLLTIDTKRVKIVTYCASQNLFAILMDDVIGFYIFQDGETISFTNKRCELRDVGWWHQELKFKALLIEEINEHIWVWLIDENNVVRGFDYDSESWDSTKEFILEQDYNHYQLSPKGSFLIALKHQYLESSKTPTGRIELHTYLLFDKKKLDYVVHSKSTTGYETGNEVEFKGTQYHNRDRFRVVDNVLLPQVFTQNNVQIDRVHIMESNTKDDMLLCTIAKDAKLLYHQLTIQVSYDRMRMIASKRRQSIRNITKLDYMEYMVEKFGSRAAIHYPQNDKLVLHTTFIMKEHCKNADNLCVQIFDKIKNCKLLTWECAVLQNNHHIKPDGKHIIKRGDEWIKNVISQIPIQIARASDSKFKVMYNGENNEDGYIKATDAYSLCKSIRFGAYDGLIKSWEGDIKVVTSAGKPCAGKSCILNHLFGTHFDVAGVQSTEGGWLSVKIIDDILYVVCDFEGLGSFERSPQEHTLLTTFNSAISNCTIFKCDKQFDSTVEDFFSTLQRGLKIMNGSQNCFNGQLLMILKDVLDSKDEEAVADFKRHFERLVRDTKQQTKANAEIEEKKNEEINKKESSFFVSQMYQSGWKIMPFPPLKNELFWDALNDTLGSSIKDLDVIHVGGKVFLDHIKLIMAKLHFGDFNAMKGEQAKIRSLEIRSSLQNAVETGAVIQPSSTIFGATFQADNEQNLLLLDNNQIITVSVAEITSKIKKFKKIITENTAIHPQIEETLISMLDEIDDAGLILGKVESLGFLWEQFSCKIKRKHDNVKRVTAIYQIFLDLIYWRRHLRVSKFISDNLKKIQDEKKSEVESLIEAADAQLNTIRLKMKLCKIHCSECFYPCLLCKNHEEDNNWADDHSCNQTKHSCQEFCDFCLEKDKQVQCVDRCGHPGKHDCRSDHSR